MNSACHRLSRVMVLITTCCGGGAIAADAPQVRAWAASCASCHGTEGRSAGGMPVLAGADRDRTLQALLAFKADARDATIMHQLAKGYSDEELRQLANYFADQTP